MLQKPLDKCENCSKTFSRSDKLHDHIEKKLCQPGASKEDNRQNHLHSCDNCGKSFSRIDSLERHKERRDVHYWKHPMKYSMKLFITMKKGTMKLQTYEKYAMKLLTYELLLWKYFIAYDLYFLMKYEPMKYLIFSTLKEILLMLWNNDLWKLS